MATIDVHRLLDNALSAQGTDKKCESVTMYVVYTATIDGDAIPVSVQAETLPEDIAAAIMAELGLTDSDNAAAEGEDAPDEDELEDEADDEPAPKKSSKKKK